RARSRRREERGREQSEPDDEEECRDGTPHVPSFRSIACAFRAERRISREDATLAISRSLPPHPPRGRLCNTAHKIATPATTGTSRQLRSGATTAQRVQAASSGSK